jgi:hypothetical protein
MNYKNKMVTLKNLILKYIGMNNINILKRNCQVGINVVFVEVILKLYDVRFKKAFSLPHEHVSTVLTFT